MHDPSACLAEEKQRVRERLRFRRKHFVANRDSLARFAAFRTLPDSLVTLLAGRDPVAAYVAWGEEPDVLEPLGALPLALPYHIDRARPMSFRRWSPAEALHAGPWGPQQPSGDGDTVEPALILCPLVGFDREGGRIGQGGGHYDRYFAAHPDIPRIGVGWSVQEVDAIPSGSTDATLDAIWTEQELIICGDRL